MARIRTAAEGMSPSERSESSGATEFAATSCSKSSSSSARLVVKMHCSLSQKSFAVSPWHRQPRSLRSNLTLAQAS